MNVSILGDISNRNVRLVIKDGVCARALRMFDCGGRETRIIEHNVNDICVTWEYRTVCLVVLACVCVCVFFGRFITLISISIARHWKLRSGRGGKLCLVHVQVYTEQSNHADISSIIRLSFYGNHCNWPLSGHIEIRCSRMGRIIRKRAIILR